MNSTLFGIMDVFDSLADTTGDATRSLSGWNFAVKQQIETEEQRAQLAIDLANSLGAHLIPELVELQHTGESLADTAARVQAEYALVNAALDLTGQTLNKTGLASIGLHSNLVQLLGGLQGASGLLQPFFQEFYSEAERAASTGRLMNAELAKLGVTTIPATREQFRALVEAQDLNTQAGQGMFAALIKLAPAFSFVTEAMENSEKSSLARLHVACLWMYHVSPSVQADKRSIQLCRTRSEPCGIREDSAGYGKVPVSAITACEDDD